MSILLFLIVVPSQETKIEDKEVVAFCAFNKVVQRTLNSTLLYEKQNMDQKWMDPSTGIFTAPNSGNMNNYFKIGICYSRHLGLDFKKWYKSKYITVACKETRLFGIFPYKLLIF